VARLLRKQLPHVATDAYDRCDGVTSLSLRLLRRRSFQVTELLFRPSPRQGRTLARHAARWRLTRKSESAVAPEPSLHAKVGSRPICSGLMGEPTASVTERFAASNVTRRVRLRSMTSAPSIRSSSTRRLSDCVEDGRLDSRDRQPSSAAGSPVGEPREVALANLRVYVDLAARNEVSATSRIAGTPLARRRGRLRWCDVVAGERSRRGAYPAALVEILPERR